MLDAGTAPTREEKTTVEVHTKRAWFWTGVDIRSMGREMRTDDWGTKRLTGLANVKEKVRKGKERKKE